MGAHARAPWARLLLPGLLLTLLSASACRRSECQAYQDQVTRPLLALRGAGETLAKLSVGDRTAYLSALDRQIVRIDRAVAALRAVRPEGSALRSAHADLVSALTTWANALQATRAQIVAPHPDRAALDAAQQAESKAAQRYGVAEARICDACDWEPPGQN